MANGDTVDTESLINQAIDAKAQRDAQRQSLGTQRDRLIQQLGSTGRNRGQYRQIQANISKLDLADRALHSQDISDQQLLNTKVSSAFRNTQMAHKLSSDALNLQTAQQAGEVFTGFANLMSTAKPGTQAFRDGMEALKAQYPLGFASEAVKGHLGPITQFHDQEDAQNRKNLAQALFKGNGLSPEQFASFTNPRATNASLVGKDGKPTIPTLDDIEKQRSNKGANVAFDVNGQTHIVPRSLFENLQSTFTPKPASGGVVPSEVNYSVPADVPPSGTNYTFSGTGTPNHPGDYWSEQLQGGLVKHHFASGGSATMPDSTTPEGAATINTAREQTAARKQYLEKNTSALTIAGGATQSSTAEGGLRANFPINLPTTSAAPQVANAPAAANPSVLVQPYQLGNEPTPTAATPTQQVAVQPQGQPNMLTAPTNPAERVAGQIYTSPNGKIGRWTGTEWVEQ